MRAGQRANPRPARIVTARRDLCDAPAEPLRWDWCRLVGLEPTRVAPLPPQASVSTNSATSALKSLMFRCHCLRPGSSASAGGAFRQRRHLRRRSTRRRRRRLGAPRPIDRRSSAPRSRGRRGRRASGSSRRTASRASPSCATRTSPSRAHRTRCPTRPRRSRRRRRRPCPAAAARGRRSPQRSST